MNIKLMISVPPPEQTSKAASKPAGLTPEERVRHYIELVESGHKSDVEWIALNKIYRDLCSRPKNARVENLINMIKPVLAHYGYHGVTSEGK